MHEYVVEEGGGFVVGDFVLVEVAEGIDLADIEPQPGLAHGQRQRVAGLRQQYRRLVAVGEREYRGVGGGGEGGRQKAETIALAHAEMREQGAFALAYAAGREFDFDVGTVVDAALVLAMGGAAHGALADHHQRGLGRNAIQYVEQAGFPLMAGDLSFHVFEAADDFALAGRAAGRNFRYEPRVVGF